MFHSSSHKNSKDHHFPDVFQVWDREWATPHEDKLQNKYLKNKQNQQNTYTMMICPKCVLNNSNSGRLLTDHNHMAANAHKGHQNTTQWKEHKCFLWRSITLTVSQPTFVFTGALRCCDTEPRITVVILIIRQSCQQVFELFQLKWLRSYRCLKDVVKHLSDTSDRVRFRGFNSWSVCLKPPQMATLSFSSSIAT